MQEEGDGDVLRFGRHRHRLPQASLPFLMAIAAAAPSLTAQLRPRPTLASAPPDFARRIASAPPTCARHHARFRAARLRSIRAST